MEQRRLLVGFDLCNDFSRISYYDEKNYETKEIGTTEEKMFPTVLAYRQDTGEWFYGHDALEISKTSQCTLITDILKLVTGEKEIFISESKVDGVTILSKYFRKTLSNLKSYFPDESIKKLVVTVEKQSKELDHVIYKALEVLGIERDRCIVQGHMASFVYYVLSQKREIWCNDVGLFYFNDSGLTYSQMKIDRHKTPMLVALSNKDFSDVLNYNMMKSETIHAELSYIFEDLAMNALHKQIISSIYITGKGFDGNWADKVFHKICAGRRVFLGRNLFVSGACYAAKEMIEEGRLEEFIFLSDEMVSSYITMNVYADAKVSECILVKPSNIWYEVDEKYDFIVDQEKEMEITIKNVLRRESSKHFIPFEMPVNRENKMTRITLRIRFSDIRTCIITIKDLGFGDICPTSNRIWEKSIEI